MTRVSTLIFYRVILFSLLVQCIVAQKNCTTTSGGQGTCKGLHYCDVVWNKVSQNPLYVVGEVYRGGCIVNLFNVQVCCPDSESTVQEENSNQENSSPRQSGALQPPSCGRSFNNVHNKIVGGNVAVRGAWPWIAHLGLRLSNGVGWFCGATLVTSRHVVTAAHCLERRANYVVRLGGHSRSSSTGAIDVPVQSYTNHPRYNKKNYENDISVMRLSRPVQFSRTIQPICLPISNAIGNRDLTGTHPFVAGWGATKYKGPSSDVLREVQVPVVSLAQCKRAYGNSNSAIDERVLCAGNTGKDSCQGDSGGPLMMPNENTWYLIGVVSSGYECASPGYPGIYTRTSAFLNFILPNLN